MDKQQVLEIALGCELPPHYADWPHGLLASLDKCAAQGHFKGKATSEEMAIRWLQWRARQINARAA